MVSSWSPHGDNQGEPRAGDRDKIVHPNKKKLLLLLIIISLNVREVTKIMQEIIHPLHYKGFETNLNNYRGISLLAVVYKIYDYYKLLWPFRHNLWNTNSPLTRN